MLDGLSVKKVSRRMLHLVSWEERTAVLTLHLRQIPAWANSSKQAKQAKHCSLWIQD